MRILSICVLIAALIWAFFPGNTVTTWPLIAHLTAFPVLIGVLLGLIGLVGVFLRRFRPLLAAGAVLVIAGAGSFLPVQQPSVSDDDGGLIVLEWNTGDAVTPETLGALIREVIPTSPSYPSTPVRSPPATGPSPAARCPSPS